MPANDDDDGERDRDDRQTSTARIHVVEATMEESITLEETNKIRISLGLEPLTDDKAPADNEEEAAERNYAQRRADEAKERDRK